MKLMTKSAPTSAENAIAMALMLMGGTRSGSGVEGTASRNDASRGVRVARGRAQKHRVGLYRQHGHFARKRWNVAVGKANRMLTQESGGRPDRPLLLSLQFTGIVEAPA